LFAEDAWSGFVVDKEEGADEEEEVEEEGGVVDEDEEVEEDEEEEEVPVVVLVLTAAAALMAACTCCCVGFIVVLSTPKPEKPIDGARKTFWLWANAVASALRFWSALSWSAVRNLDAIGEALQALAWPTRNSGGL
jgi:hypothetical protein